MKKPMKWLKRTAAFAVTMGAVLFAMPASVSAETVYNINDSAVTISADGDYTIKGNGTETTNTITIESGVSANITLDGVNISNVALPPIKIADNTTGDVKIILAEGSENTLIGDYAVEMNSENGSLEITGKGKLTVEGGYVGIGSYFGYADITISGGDVSVSATETGIGSVEGNADITISGGDVSVSAVQAGIGSRDRNADITISGGNITASGIYQAIGSYYEKGNITISGGTIAAYNESDGIFQSAIWTNNILISGGFIKAEAKGFHCYGIACKERFEITGGTVIASGGDMGCGISINNAAGKIKISGGTVTAYCGKGGAAIGVAKPLIITGGSVKAVKGGDYIEGYPSVEIGDCGIYTEMYKAPSRYIPPVDADGNEAYLLTIANPDSKPVIIDGKEYSPLNHTAADKNDTNLYVYLSAGSAEEPHEISVGGKTVGYYYDTEASKWIFGPIIPKTDSSSFIYNGREQTYNIPESDFYTVTGNKQTNAGTYTVTVKLNEGMAWIDGTTADKTYEFVIAKAKPEITVKAAPASDIAGKTIKVTASAVNPENDSLTDIPAVSLTYKVGADGDETPFTDSFVIPEGTPEGTVITVTARTAENGNYLEAVSTIKVNVTDCEHNDVSTDWYMDKDCHWHICGYCTAELDKAEHTFSGWLIVNEATEESDGTRMRACTVCGFEQSESVKYSYPIITEDSRITVDRNTAKAGESVNVKTPFGYDAVVYTVSGQKVAQITEKGSFVMPASRVYIRAVMNDTLKYMANSFDHSYVYSYDSDMNRIKINSTRKRGIIVINLGDEYAGCEFTVYEGRKSTSVKVTEGVLDENGRYTLDVDDGKNYTLIVEE
ncbi:MAG: carbohydrate-binding domain-containing protein [Oscillospiraceae bacterium]|nr:carbohydrate-binding domain-containing protein [Oscillospiraceae bacterium]